MKRDENMKEEQAETIRKLAASNFLFLVLFALLMLINLNFVSAELNYTTGEAVYTDYSWDDTYTNSNFTISAWVYPKSSGVLPIIYRPFSYSLRINSDGRLEFRFNNGTNFSSTGSIEQNNWTFVAVSYNGSSVNLYIGTNNKTFVPYSRGYYNSTGAFEVIIGKDAFNYFNGTIDEVKIFNKYLDENQIRFLYYIHLIKLSFEQWILNILQGGIEFGLSYFYSISITDLANNLNFTDIITVSGNIAPAFGEMNYTPNSSGVLDPGVVLTVRANITDVDNNFETAVFQWKNYTAEWGNATNISMNNLSEISVQTIFNASFIPTYESNYSYRIWTNDTQGSVGISNITNVSVFLDCTWVLDYNDFSATSGFVENKFIGNISINNTGDINYANNNCTLDFRLSYDLAEGRIYFGDDYIKPTYSNSLEVGQNRTIGTNATFLTELNEESVVISVSEFRGRSETALRNITASLVTNPGGPYLYQKIVSTPTYVYLTPGTFALSAYLRNVAGNDTDSNTAFNVSFNWSLPSDWSVSEGNASLNYSNLSDSQWNYNNVNITFDATNLGSMSPGSYTLYTYAYGHNSSGAIVNHSGGRTILTEEATVILSCYNVSDGVTITVCGSLDGDYVASNGTTTTTVTTVTSGGGGAAAKYAKSEGTFELVRGGKQEFDLEIKNKYPDDMKNVKVSVTGINSEFIEFEPSVIDKIKSSSSGKIKVKITAPSYFSESEYRLVFYIEGYLVSGYNENPFTEKKIIILKILEVDRTQSTKFLEDSREMLEKMRKKEYNTKEIEKLLVEIEFAYNQTDFGVVKNNYERVKILYDSSVLSDKLMKDLNEKIADAEKYGISVNEARKLVNLAESAFLRGGYETSVARLKEAQLAYALETKGEFGLAYYVRKKPLETGGVALLAGLAVFGSSVFLRKKILNARLRVLEEEEKLLIGLMKVIQKECFEQGKLSMDEYGNAMTQYETRLNMVIQDKISTETKLANLMRLKGGKEKSLKEEAARLKELMKKTQKLYFSGSKIETRIYENMLRSYSERLSEVEEKLATIDAQKTLRARGFKI
ncbi:hypothetical protein COV15_03260 [Candidatus Woesearchaeota archaeon CG10_big_fil_rev_8_21_14_0_10_34_12]|nr:MAG: hypothetical protein COV15_03260 [Candidatus Woesearchaeota archaeon CG10_big_fil_rev_8_21_14_0_10_34_12]